MRLYPKKLRTVEDLEREKKLLLKESKRIEEEGFLSIEGIFNNKGDKEESGVASLLDFIPVSNPLVGMLIKLARQKLSDKKNNPKVEATEDNSKKKKGKNPLKAVAFEVIGGYLKWKAIELSYKGIRNLVKKRKEKRATADRQGDY